MEWKYLHLSWIQEFGSRTVLQDVNINNLFLLWPRNKIFEIFFGLMFCSQSLKSVAGELYRLLRHLNTVFGIWFR